MTLFVAKRGQFGFALFVIERATTCLKKKHLVTDPLYTSAFVTPLMFFALSSMNNYPRSAA
jgi:hypothetical protein